MSINENIESATSAPSKPAAREQVWIRSDTVFVGLVTALVLLVTSLPYAYAYLTEPAGQQYMGIMVNVPDHTQYFSWMRELTDANLAANKMTPEANRPLFFNLLWWGMGRLGNLLNVGFAEMFQVLRVVSTITFLPLAYRMVAWFLKERWMARLAFLVLTFTSGFGWVLVVIKYLTGNELLFPLNVFIAEANTFYCILGYPHFIAALLYILVFDLVLRGQVKGQLRYSVWAGLFALFLGWQHAYDLAIIYGVLGAYALLLWLRDRRLPMYMVKSGLIIGLISFWPALYSVALTSLDPVWEEVLKQFANAGVFTPGLLHLPILLGVAFLLALYTVIRDNPLRLRQVSDNDLFLRGWFLISFVLVYLPVDYQIHMLNGWQVPYAILAVIGLDRYVIPWLSRVAKIPDREVVRRWAAAALMLMIIPTNLYLLAWRFVDLGRHDHPYYLYDDELDAMRWLDQNAQEDDVVFSSITIGQYIPAMTGTHAYLAHWAQTLDFFTKSDNVELFYGGGLTEDGAQSILQASSVDYVFVGPAERKLGAANPVMDTGEVVFQNAQVTIYRVGQ